MPISRHRLHDTRNPPPPPANGHGHDELRTPQARVLAVLMPDDPTVPKFDWPVLNRVYLGKALGFRPTSGSLTRVLNGIRPDNRTSGKPHVGLITLGLIEALTLQLDSCEEVNYRITSGGIAAYQAYLARGGKLPPVKDAATCTNARYAEVQGGKRVLAFVGKGVADAGR